MSSTIKEKMITFHFGSDGSLVKTIKMVKEDGIKLSVFCPNVELDEDFNSFRLWFGKAVYGNPDVTFLFKEYQPIAHEYPKDFPNVRIVPMDYLQEVGN